MKYDDEKMEPLALVKYHPCRLEDVLTGMALGKDPMEILLEISSMMMMVYQKNNPLVTDLLPQVFSYCDAESLCSAAMVSKEWNRFSSDSELWEQRCRQTFGVSSQQIKHCVNPKDLYRLCYLQQRQVCRLSQAFMDASIPSFIPVTMRM